MPNCYQCPQKADYCLLEVWDYLPDELHPNGQKVTNKFYYCLVCFNEKTEALESEVINDNGHKVKFANPPLTYCERVNEVWYGIPLPSSEHATSTKKLN